MDKKRLLMLLVLMIIVIFTIGYKNNFFNKYKNGTTKYLIEKYGFKTNEIKIIEHERICDVSLLSRASKNCNQTIIFETNSGKKITVKGTDIGFRWGDDYQMEQIKNDIVKYFQLKIGKKVSFVVPDGFRNLIYMNNKYDGQNIEKYFGGDIDVYIGLSDTEKSKDMKEYMKKFSDFCRKNKTSTNIIFYHKTEEFNYSNFNNDYNSYTFVIDINETYCRSACWYNLSSGSFLETNGCSKY